jgi:hypothetical protein
MSSLHPSQSPVRQQPLDWVVLALICALGIGMAARNVTDEGFVTLDGDMPRYLMNGVFLRDLLLACPWKAPLEFAEHYYARYPALSLGHHPLLPAIAEVPFFLTLGVSVFSARISVLAALALGLVCWFRLVRSIYDAPTACFASLLLISTPGFITLFQLVLSEPYTLSLIITCVYLMHRYAVTERPVFGVAFVVCAVASAYAKHLAVFMFPVYLLQFVAAFGVRRLFTRPVILAMAAAFVGLVPLVPLTLEYSQVNVQIAQHVDSADRVGSRNLLQFARRLWDGPFGLTAALMGLAGVSAATALFRRDRRILLFVIWAGAIYLGVVALAVGNDRFVCYWLPAFAGMAAAGLHASPARTWRVAFSIAVLATVGYQLWLVRETARPGQSVGIIPDGAGGYEDAARFVTEHRRGDSVLYSAAVDTGYFVFHVRKHDSRREMIVLRADKVLTTSRMGALAIEDKIADPSEIRGILKRFGVGYVVIENRPYPDGPLRWLEDAVRGDDFDHRLTVPIESRARRMAGATVSVYEYRGRVPADPHAPLDMRILHMNGTIQLRMGQLIRRPPADSSLQPE